MIRITDLETDLALDLSLPAGIEEALRIQLSRYFDASPASRFVADLASWMSVAVFQSVDRDLWPPTERQRHYATQISRSLGMSIPEEALQFRGSMTQFLAHFAPAFVAQRGVRGKR